MAMKKTIIRTIRFSDEMVDIIEQQVGENFTQKFERLVYNCYMLAAAKEEECKRLDAQISIKRDQLRRYQKEAQQLGDVVQSIQRQLTAVDNYLEEYINTES